MKVKVKVKAWVNGRFRKRVRLRNRAWLRKRDMGLELESRLDIRSNGMM